MSSLDFRERQILRVQRTFISLNRAKINT